MKGKKTQNKDGIKNMGIDEAREQIDNLTWHEWKLFEL